MQGTQSRMGQHSYSACCSHTGANVYSSRPRSMAAAASPLIWGTASPLIWGNATLLGHGHYFASALSALVNPATGRKDAVLSTTDKGIVRSQDGGLTWTALGGDRTTIDVLTAGASRHNFGTVEARYQGQRAPFHDFWGSGATRFAIDGDGSLTATPLDANITFVGSPRPLGCIVTGCCNCPFRTDSGNVVQLADGSQLVVLNVFPAPLANRSASGDGSSVAVYRSDADGVSWTFLSFVATAEDYPWSGEGPNEATLTLLADGTTLLCIVRMDAGDGHASGKPCARLRRAAPALQHRHSRLARGGWGILAHL